MATSSAKTVKQYLDELPPDRRAALQAVRKVIKKNLPPGFKEGIDFGMIGWFVPLSRYPDTYNGHPLGVAALASQKGYMSLYLTCVYGDPKLRKWFEAESEKRGKKLDMGKSCVRFKSIDDLPLDLIGEAVGKVTVDDLIEQHERVHGKKKQPRSAARRATRAKA